ncbi:hypothetical protein BIW11_13271 [Tropilaelaps mercedesae]|uniref:Uncharacterized protein n=1 Tax=Tropilaelaps mercedesae TaxID=418985 RepID=A0A1V9X2N1_9ACAR|nr:hypothetical protein BIW11_13271 [Tropilaelaps mercedesae]
MYLLQVDHQIEVIPQQRTNDGTLGPTSPTVEELLPFSSGIPGSSIKRRKTDIELSNSDDEKARLWKRSSKRLASCVTDQKSCSNEKNVLPSKYCGVIDRVDPLTGADYDSQGASMRFNNETSRYVAVTSRLSHIEEPKSQAEKSVRKSARIMAFNREIVNGATPTTSTLGGQDKTSSGTSARDKDTAHMHKGRFIKRRLKDKSIQRDSTITTPGSDQKPYSVTASFNANRLGSLSLDDLRQSGTNRSAIGIPADKLTTVEKPLQENDIEPYDDLPSGSLENPTYETFIKQMRGRTFIGKPANVDRHFTKLVLITRPVNAECEDLKTLNTGDFARSQVEEEAKQPSASLAMQLISSHPKDFYRFAVGKFALPVQPGTRKGKKHVRPKKNMRSPLTKVTPISLKRKCTKIQPDLSEAQTSTTDFSKVMYIPKYKSQRIQVDLDRTDSSSKRRRPTLAELQLAVVTTNRELRQTLAESTKSAESNEIAAFTPKRHIGKLEAGPHEFSTNTDSLQERQDCMLHKGSSQVTDTAVQTLPSSEALSISSTVTSPPIRFSPSRDPWQRNFQSACIQVDMTKSELVPHTFVGNVACDMTSYRALNAQELARNATELHPWESATMLEADFDRSVCRRFSSILIAEEKNFVNSQRSKTALLGKETAPPAANENAGPPPEMIAMETGEKDNVSTNTEPVGYTLPEQIGKAHQHIDIWKEELTATHQNQKKPFPYVGSKEQAATKTPSTDNVHRLYHAKLPWLKPFRQTCRPRNKLDQVLYSNTQKCSPQVDVEALRKDLLERPYIRGRLVISNEVFRRVNHVSEEMWESFYERLDPAAWETQKDKWIAQKAARRRSEARRAAQVTQNIDDTMEKEIQERVAEAIGRVQSEIAKKEKANQGMKRTKPKLDDELKIIKGSMSTIDKRICLCQVADKVHNHERIERRSKKLYQR